jgi:hypothetical protein
MSARTSSFGLQFFAMCRNKIRAADAKEVGVGNPAEETCCYPNTGMLQSGNNLSTFERKIVRKNRFLPVI